MFYKLGIKQILVIYYFQNIISCNKNNDCIRIYIGRSRFFYYRSILNKVMSNLFSL